MDGFGHLEMEGLEGPLVTVLITFLTLPLPLLLSNPSNSADTKQDDIIDALRKEALSELKSTLVTSDDQLDIQTLIEEALDEEFEKAASKIKDSAFQLRSETEAELKDIKRDTKMSELLEADRLRLEAGEARVNSLVTKVQRETANVESAMSDLRRAQSNSVSDDPLMKVLNFRNLPLQKQAALTACILFTFRVPFDVISGTDVSGVIVQAFIAVAAGAYFLL